MFLRNRKVEPACKTVLLRTRQAILMDEETEASRDDGQSMIAG
jgi:hypothetical protein